MAMATPRDVEQWEPVEATQAFDDAVDDERTLAPLPAPATSRAVDDSWASVDATQVGSGAPTETDPSFIHERLGRHMVIGTLGRGGMGAVYAAYDPELDRKLAIKVILGHTGELEQARLQREAQAMARLSHPRVVSVHDVGVHEGELYIAMEYVEGKTLRGWLEWQDRTPTQICAMFRQAGEGLAAAHEVGLIHRDFKPDNVLVSNAGAAKVTDFGLARATDRDELAHSERSPPSNNLGSSSLTTPLTHVGAIMGTPAYMAPEQFAAAPTDARTDQFSFCVALYEALWGERPFAGSTFEDLSRAVREGERRPRPSGSEVPSWLEPIIDRGLSTAPADRWPSMDALLDALAADPTLVRRRRIGAALTAGIALGLAGLVWLSQVQTERRCEARGQAVAALWSDAAQARTQELFAASSAPHAEDSHRRLVDAIDAWAGAWAPQRTEACMAAVDELPQAESRAQCLDAALDEFGVTLELIQGGGAQIIDAAVDLGASLPRLERCTERSWLAEYELRAREGQLEQDASAQLAELESDLWRAHGLQTTGDYAQGAELSASVAERARQREGRGFTRLALSAALHEADMRVRIGETERGREQLEQTYFEAASSERERLAMDAAAQLVWLESGADNSTRALDWARHAQTYVERLGGPKSEAAKKLYERRAIARISAGQFEGAREDLDAALALAREQDGPEHPHLYSLYNNLALLAKETSDLEAALEAGTRAVEFARAAYGPAHPELATALLSLGGAQFGAGDYEQARASFEQALRIYEPALGPNHPHMAIPFNNLAAIHYKQGRYAEAVTSMRRAVEIREAELGPEHPQVGSGLANLGTMQHALGEDEAALRSFERGLDILERALDPKHPRLAGPLLNLSSLQIQRGQLDEALSSVTRAVEIRGEAFGPTHARTALALSARARVLREQGQLDAASADLRTAWEAQLEALGPDHPDLSMVALELARVEFDRQDHAAAAQALDWARTAAASLPPTHDRRAAIEALAAELTPRTAG